MTAKELAQRLNEREWDCVITVNEEKEAAESGLVVGYMDADDRLILNGAIEYEAGAYERCTVYIKDGCAVTPPECCEDASECPLFRKENTNAKAITAVWHGDVNPCWTIETNIPHEIFNIYDDEWFVVGIVFDVADTMDKPAGLDRSRWEGCGYCSDQQEYEFLFCPYCGRPLTKEAWTKLERRIRNDEKID